MPDSIVFRAPSQMRTVAGCSNWNLGAIPADGSHVTIDLGSWQQISPTPLIAIITTLAGLSAQGHTLTLNFPKSDYARRVLHLVGVGDALRTFGDWKISGPDPLPMKRYYPIVPVRNFKTQSDVDNIIHQLEIEFSRSSLLPATLLQDVTTALAEAAGNVVWHARSEVGGFALMQVRQLRRRGMRIWFVEVAVGDPGIRIAASLAMSNDRDAILLAMEGGTSSVPDKHRGYGLFEIAETVQKAENRIVQIHSGNGLVTQAFQNRISQAVSRRFNGTLVTVAIPFKVASPEMTT